MARPCLPPLGGPRRYASSSLRQRPQASGSSMNELRGKRGRRICPTSLAPFTATATSGDTSPARCPTEPSRSRPAVRVARSLTGRDAPVPPRPSHLRPRGPTRHCQSEGFHGGLSQSRPPAAPACLAGRDAAGPPQPRSCIQHRMAGRSQQARTHTALVDVTTRQQDVRRTVTRPAQEEQARPARLTQSWSTRQATSLGVAFGDNGAAADRSPTSSFRIRWRRGTTTDQHQSSRERHARGSCEP